MHAVVVTVTINEPEAALQMLRDEVVPRASQSPGFVTGYWLRSEDNNLGLSMIVFESEEAARSVAREIESAGPPRDAVTFNSVEVREVAAHA
jgi:hypothetical protein